MATIKKAIITNKGRELLTRELAGEIHNITFTKIKTSNQKIEDSVNVEEMIELENIKQETDITLIKIIDDVKLKISGVFNNKNLAHGYNLETIGIYAKSSNKEEQEVLYAVILAEIPDNMPAENGINLSSIEMEFIVSVNRSSNVKISVNPSTIATSAMVETLKENVNTNFVKYTDLAEENKAGVVTLAKIKEISPKADLSNYVTFNKGYRVTDSTNWVIRSNLSETWMPHQALMFNENGNYTGTFHLNGSRAYYKAPNRNGGNWLEIMDSIDRDNLQSQINAHLNGYQFSKTGSGYCKFPNGFIIQWGWGTTNTPTNFPIAFPNACFKIVATQNGYSEIYENMKVMDGWTNYNFRMKLLGDQMFYFFYIAIGF